MVETQASSRKSYFGKLKEAKDLMARMTVLEKVDVTAKRP